MRKSASYWIERLNLSKHPEGGYFKEVYKSDELLLPSSLPDRYSESRTFATSIYFLIKSGQKSKLHWLKSDETWVLIDGSPIQLHLFRSVEEYRSLTLGKDLENSQIPQFTIPRFTHFGAAPLEKESYSLVACIVTPGFEFNDFSFSDKKELIEIFPQQRDIIEVFS